MPSPCLRASSTAIQRVKLSIPVLATEYASTPLSCRIAAMDEMLITQPCPVAAIASPKTIVGATVPWRLRRSASSNASRGTSKMLRSSFRARVTLPPAVFTRMSTLPHAREHLRRARREAALRRGRRRRYVIASPPAARMRSACASAASRRRPRIATLDARCGQSRCQAGTEDAISSGDERRLAGEPVGRAPTSSARKEMDECVWSRRQIWRRATAVGKTLPRRARRPARTQPTASAA